MKKTVTLVFAIITTLFFFPKLSLTQNFIEGYIVNNQGDTLKGFINYRGWDKNPERIAFKSTLDTHDQYFTPRDIMFFAVADEIYRSAAVIREVSPVKMNGLDYVAEFKLQPDTVFLLTLVEGAKSLYYLKDKNWKSNFYILENGKATLLKYKRYKKKVEGSNLVMYNKHYVGQLLNYLGDCPSFASLIEHTGYSKKSLIKLFNKYYKCKNINYGYELKEQHAKLEFGFLGGVSFSKPVFQSATAGSQYYYLSQIDFSTSAFVTTAFSFEIILPRKLNRISLNTELLYTSFYSSGSYDYFKSDFEYGKYHTEIDIGAFKFNGMVRYTVPVGKISFFTDFGVDISKAFNSYTVTRSDRYYYGVTNHNWESAFQTRFTEQGVLAGIGVNYHHFSLEVRYEYSNGFSSVNSLIMNINRYYLLIGYHLKRD